jgi:hypothetical protein
MKTVIARLKGTSPYGQSAAIQSKRGTGENHDSFEERTWKERLHVDNNGIVFIPPMAIKNMLSDCAKYLSETVPGKGKATYTKHFDAGVMVVSVASLGVHRDNVESQRVFVPSDGVRGGGTRVWKTFPIIRQWGCDVEIILLDPILEDKLEKVREYLEHSGKFIGLGWFRPRNGGYYGRFIVENFEVKK